jgi:hypothetical protein
MMRKVLVLSLVICTALACNSRRKKMTALMNDPSGMLAQEQEIRGFRLKMQYLPKDSAEWCFRLNIDAEDRQVFRDDPVQSYGVDSLFRMINGGDTLLPVHAMRIANGNMSGLEYMIIFEKQPVVAGSNASLLFMDGLFTQRKVVFPLNLQAIEEIEAIN